MREGNIICFIKSQTTTHRQQLGIVSKGSDYNSFYLDFFFFSQTYKYVSFSIKFFNLSGNKNSDLFLLYILYILHLIFVYIFS